MRLAETSYDNHETGCCARFDAEAWDGREVNWVDQPFVTDRVHSIMHIPIDFGQVMTRCHAAVEAAEAWPDEPMWLSDESSAWGSELYVMTDRSVPGALMTHFTGRFLARAFEGPFRDAGKWHKEMQAYVSRCGHRPGKTYAWYTTCPRCAKKLGRNPVVLLTRVG